MNDQYQELISTLSKNHSLLLTSLLSTEDPLAWEECRHLVICPIPLLTLEMTIHRLHSGEEKRSSIPSPRDIQDAIKYAQDKYKHYLLNITKEPLSSN